MKTIEIEDDLYKYILNNIEHFGETPSQILRRLLIWEEKQANLAQESQAEDTEELKLAKVELAPLETVALEVEPEKVTPLDVTVLKTTSEHVAPSERTLLQPAEYELISEQVNEEHLSGSVSQLFTEPAFISESVVTNKFIMMLTAMYLEKPAEFVASADKIKGRTRAYLGMHLETLLNSDNNEELAQFKATKPRSIPQTPFWVITNANTARKRLILTQMMSSMGYPYNLIERIKEVI
jgi:negative modulator of initiation of replication